MKSLTHVFQLIMPTVFFKILVIYLFFFRRTVKLFVLLTEILIGVFNAYTLLGTFIWSPELFESNYIYWFFYALFSILLQYAVFSSFKGYLQMAEKDAEISRLHMEQEMISGYNNMVMDSLKQISVIRHEMRNKLQVAAALAETDPESVGKIREYIQDDIKEASLVNVSGSHPIQALINMKAAEAKRKGIHIDFHCNVQDWELRESDIISLLGISWIMPSKAAARPPPKIKVSILTRISAETYPSWRKRTRRIPLYPIPMISAIPPRKTSICTVTGRS